MEKTLKELLSLWMIGEDMKKYMFFSLNIFWWNRIAKIMQFIAAFTVIADILGAARLNHIGMESYRLRLRSHWDEELLMRESMIFR